MKTGAIKFVAISDQGHMITIWQHPRKELLASLGKKSASPMYDEENFLVGYRIGGQVWTMYTLSRWGKITGEYEYD